MTEWWQITLAIIGGALVFINFFNAIKDLVKSAKTPTTSLEERVALLERKVDFDLRTTFERYDTMFGRDKARLDSMEKGMGVILQSLLAIMKHDIDGNNVEALEDASKQLQSYMINGRNNL